MIKKKDTSYLFAKVYFLVAFLHSMWAMPFWHVTDKIIWAFYLIGALFLLVMKGSLFSFKKYAGLAVLTVFLILLGRRGSFLTMVGFFLFTSPFFVFLFLKDESKIVIYSFLRISMAWIVGVSLAAWLFNLLGMPLPSFSDFYGDSNGFYLFNNHLFYVDFLSSTNAYQFDVSVSGIMRFQSIFIEPGYLASILAVFLFIDKFNFKKFSNLVFLTAVIYTFSLAGWVMTAMGILLFVVSRKKKRLYYFFLVSIAFLLMYVGSTTYNGGDNVINSRIFERLTIDDSKVIKGNNRTSEQFDFWFENNFLTSNDILFGSYKKYEQEQNSGGLGVGWKVFFAKFGLLGILFYLFYLFSQVSKYKITYLGLCLMLLQIMFFSQVEHMFLSPCILIVYLSGAILLSKKSNIVT